MSNFKQLAQRLVEEVPKRGMSRKFQESPKLYNLAQAYLSGLHQVPYELKILSDRLGISLQHIDSVYSRFSRIISEESTKLIREDREFFIDSLNFREYLDAWDNRIYKDKQK